MLLRARIVCVLLGIAVIGEYLPLPRKPDARGTETSSASADVDTGVKKKDAPRSWERPSTFRYLIVLPKGKPFTDTKIAPGYYDGDKKTCYVWRGILFPISHVPKHYASPYNPILSIDPDEVQFTIAEYDPVVSYLKLESSKIGVGYFGLGRKDFYRWKGVVIEPEEIPDEAAKEPNRVLDPKRTIIEVDPPKHILDKPELWKKVKKAEKK
jgi:hypothetical protein